MADTTRMALVELFRKAGVEPDLDFLREAVRLVSQELMEAEVEAHLSAERYERSPERSGQRNGYRDRTWDTRVGSIPLRVPRVRDGSYFPGLLEPRTRAERALVAVVQEAYVQGVSTRRVDALVQALGMTGISTSLRQPALPGTGRRGGAVSRSPPGRPLSLSVAGRHVCEGAPGGAGGVDGGGDRHRGERQRRARGLRLRCGTQ
jgi:hypothetical protein